MFSSKFKDYLEKIILKINEIIEDLKNIKIYLGLRQDTNDSISGRLNNLEKIVNEINVTYIQYIEDIKISDNKVELSNIPIGDIYIKIYNRGDIIEEVAEIESEDFDIDDKIISIDSDIIDDLNEFDDLYAKVFYLTKIKN